MVDASALHLVRRATYGPTPAVLAEVSRLGADAWLERQLKPSSIGDGTLDAYLKRFPDLALTPTQVRAKTKNFGSWDVMLQLSRATIARALWSERQLFEVMVEFWSNHLNVTNPSSDVWDNRAHYDRNVIRKHALGSFDDMLVAASKHPAMLRYLDNASSNKWHPNENQGRELLELHTVGVGAGYSEDDVKASARILTGLTVDGNGEFVYRANWHWTGPVSLLGFSHANSAADGQDVAEQYLRHLARHPATAQQLARKLAVRFISDTPPAAIVAELARTYLDGGTAIVPVLRKLFRSPEFKAAANQKVRRPLEDVAATVRILGLGPDKAGTKGVEALHWMLNDLGQAPLSWGPPNGYPDVAGAWSSPAGTLGRWNAHLNIAARWWPNKDMLRGTGAMALMPKKLPATHSAFIDQLSLRLVHRRATAAQKAAICAFLTDKWTTVKPSTKVTKQSAIVTWRLPYVVALLLDTPAHALR